MKKNIRKLIATLCVLALIASLPVSSFADGAGLASSQQHYVKNQIKGSGSGGGLSTSTSNASGPSAKDITATGDNKTIVMPDVSSYLSDYAVMYINAGKGHSVYAHKQPGTKNNEKYMPFAYHGSQVTVLAQQNGFSCVLYHSDDNALHAAWVVSDYLSWDYPGVTEYVGPSVYYNVLVDEPAVSWSKESFVGSKQKFTLLKEPIDDCVAFTLDYQVIARNGAETKEVLGPRTVYVNDGDGWIEIGQFDYSKLGPVHVIVTLEEEMTIAAVATVASCSKPNQFQFRQSLL
ncbi:MAG: hypothetical protein IJ594_05595, partial [Oscillospiraceae bacterium]|nr:hypothetical protein [Oscillospiraceae bacterium]